MANLKLKNPSGGSLALVSADGASDLTVTFPAVTGTAMVSGNMPAFSAKPSTNQTISHNTLTKVTLDTEEFDTNNNFASSTFTPTVAGYYNVIGQVRIDFVATRQITFAGIIYKNGSNYFNPEHSFQVGSGGSFTSTANAIVPMNGSTDTIELWVYFYDYTSSASYSIIAGNTRLQGFMVRTL